MKRILTLALVGLVCAIPAMGLTATNWLVPNALTIPEMSAAPAINGSTDDTEWATASPLMNLSDITGNNPITATDLGDHAAAFRIGTYQGNLYFIVYVSDDIESYTNRNHTADSCEFRIDLTGVLVDVNNATESATDDQNMRPLSPYAFTDHADCFLNLGAGQIRGRGDGKLLVIGTEGANTVIKDTTGTGSFTPNPALQGIADYAVGTAPATFAAPFGGEKIYEFVINVSQMNMALPVSEPFGFGIAVNDDDGGNNRDGGQSAWHGGPQQPLGTYNPIIDTVWNTSIGAIQPWRRTFVREATFAEIDTAAYPAISSQLGGSSSGGGNIDLGCITAPADHSWINTPVPEQVAPFTIEFDYTPSESPMDAIFGLTNGSSVAAYADVSAIVRTQSPAGTIFDAYNGNGTGGGAYAHDADIPYAAGVTYHVRMEIDTPNKKYDVFITAPGQPEVQLANDYGFRSQQTALNNILVRTTGTAFVTATMTACNIVMPGVGPGGGEGEGEGEGEPQGNVIAANVYPPFIDAGTLVILTAPEGANYVWKKDGAVVTGETERSLVFNPVTAADAGTFTAEYTDAASAAQTTPGFALTVSPEGTVPVASIGGLILLAGACGLGGARLARRRK